MSDLFLNIKTATAATTATAAFIATNNSTVAAVAAAAGFVGGDMMDEKKIGDKIVYRNLKKNGSFLNFYKNNSKLAWTPAQDVVSYFKNGDFYVNNFKFSREVLNKTNAVSNLLFKKKIEKTDLKMDWDDLKKGTLIVGSMGQGKTQFLLNIIKQFPFKIVLHDTKGELTSYFYNPKKDYIINFLDRRGCYINFFKENEKGLNYSLIQDFFNAYFVAAAGEKGDKFWQEMAAIRFKEKFEELKIDTSLTAAQKQKELIKELIKYVKVEAEKKGKTEQSIATNLEVNLEIFVRMAWMEEEGFKEFSFIDFFNSKDSKVFLNTVEKAAELNIPFITSILTVLFKMQLSREKVEKNEYILYVLDEYLTFFNLLKKDLKKSLHTKARSSGALLLPAVQYLPREEEDRLNLLSSIEQLFLFAITDTTTIEQLQKFVGKRIIANVNKKESSESESEHYFLNDNKIKTLKVGEHITYLPKRNILYMGKTRLPSVREKTKGFDEISYREENDFIKFKKNLEKEVSSIF